MARATAAVYDLTNTSRGGSQEYTVELTRPLLDNWSASIAYTYTHATQVDPFTSSVAASGFKGQPIINPNDNIAYKSNYSVPNKFVATFTRQFNFFKQKYSMTSISAQFLTETGQAYSFVFKGDADGSGITGESLFYVPSGPNDPKVEWLSATEEANFFSYMASNPQLSKWAGKIAPRNSATAGEQATLNLHVEQQVPLYWRNYRVVALRRLLQLRKPARQEVGHRGQLQQLVRHPDDRRHRLRQGHEQVHLRVQPRHPRDRRRSTRTSRAGSCRSAPGSSSKTPDPPNLPLATAAPTGAAVLLSGSRAGRQRGL